MSRRRSRQATADDYPPWPTGGLPGRPPGPPAVPVDAGAAVRATLKLEPLLRIADGTASGWLFAFSIVIGCPPVWAMSTVYRSGWLTQR